MWLPHKMCSPSDRIAQLSVQQTVRNGSVTGQTHRNQNPSNEMAFIQIMCPKVRRAIYL